jgi:tRNA A-37 threonylcarbamoyl transferase component Bud32
MTDSKGPRPRALGTCPTCGQAFELSLRVCPTHRVALQDLAPRTTEPLTLFDASDARTDLDRTMLGAEVAATLPGAPPVTPLEPPAARRLRTQPPAVTLLEPALRPHAPDTTPLEPVKAVSARSPSADQHLPSRSRARLPEVTPVEPVASVQRPEAPTVPAGVAAVPVQPLPAPSVRSLDRVGPSRSAPNLGGPLTSVAGQLFDGYLTTGVLAEGGMGIVYEAQHPILGTQAVVKVLKKLFTADPVSMRRMVTEGQTLSALTHRNVVRVFGFGYLQDGRPWLLMERLVGETLYTLLETRGALPLDEALPLMRQLAAGLEATHALGVVHRDLKPDNVYVVVEPDGERLVKLIDFGIARPDTLDSPADARTAVGRFVGTPAYGAPELFIGGPFAPAADVYALGVVFFEMLAGRRPFTATSLPELTKQHLDATPPPLSEVKPGVEPRMEALVASMLSKRADERPTIEQVRAELDALAAPPPPPKASPTPWVVVGVLAVVLVALALAVLLR